MKFEMTVREMVADAQRQVIRDDFMPAEARNLLMKMNGLIGLCNRETREAEVAYKRVLRDEMAQQKAAARARINAECSDEYLRWREAHDIGSEVEEMIRSLKKALSSLDSEASLAR